MSHGNEMICQPVTLAGYAEWPKVADAVIEAEINIRKSQFNALRTLNILYETLRTFVRLTR
jgi:hypothetical protein